MAVPTNDLAADAAIARAFARGCDARYVGQPRDSYPPEYRGRTANNLRTYWLMGWDHIDKEWATEKHIRWATRPPAPVQPSTNGKHDYPGGPMP